MNNLSVCICRREFADDRALQRHQLGCALFTHRSQTLVERVAARGIRGLKRRRMEELAKATHSAQDNDQIELSATDSMVCQNTSTEYTYSASCRYSTKQQAPLSLCRRKPLRPLVQSQTYRCLSTLCPYHCPRLQHGPGPFDQLVIACLHVTATFYLRVLRRWSMNHRVLCSTH